MLKKCFSILFVCLLLTTFTACGSLENEADSYIEGKGCFLLEPAKDLDLSKENLDDVQKYLFVIYDVINPTKSNIEVSEFCDGVTIKLGENKYEQLYHDPEYQALNGFLDNCGYTSSYRLDTLWSGSTQPIRCIAAFAVNKNDFTENSKGIINFDLADKFATTKTISVSDIQTIDYFDGVYVVEGDKEDDYQIARSISRRVEIADNALDACIINLNSKNEKGASVPEAILSTIFSENTSWGVSISGSDEYVISDSLPTFKVNAVTRIYPEIQDRLTTMINNINTFVKAVGTKEENRDYASANKSINLLKSDFKYFKDYFNVD